VKKMSQLNNKRVLVIKLKESDIVLTPETREWCKLPYPNHPDGCPNYGKKADCPPNAPWFTDVVKPPYTLVGVRFNLQNHIRKMRKKHPNWTHRQLKCLLYWQNKVRSQLRKKCEKVATKIEDAIIVYNGEAMGINYFATCKNIGLILERNPRKYVWKIAIIGKK